MAFRLHLLVAFVALCLLSLYSADAYKLGWPKALSWPWSKSKPKIVGFSWSNCGPGSDPIQIKSLSISPDPIKIPGNITIATSFAFTAALPTDIGVSVNMEKKVAGFFIKVPCVDNVGSCHYGDICKDWAEACPKYFEKYGIPCACPLPVGTFSIPDAIADITSKLPSGASGEFRVTGDIVSGSGHLGCLKLDIKLDG